MPYPLLDLLEARGGIVAAVGAGGKKTTLYRLLADHPGRVLLTATVNSAPPPSRLGVRPYTLAHGEDAAVLARALAGERCCAVYGSSIKKGRVGGLDPSAIAILCREGGFDAAYVKADGARMRGIKAPKRGEPIIPADCRTVLALVSAAVFGRPLTDELAHRVDLLSAVTGAAAGDILRPDHVARLIASEDGLLQAAGNATVVPLINQVDNDERAEAARAAARQALALTDRIERIVLASMRRDDPIVDVVERG